MNAICMQDGIFEMRVKRFIQPEIMLNGSSGQLCVCITPGINLHKAHVEVYVSLLLHAQCMACLIDRLTCKGYCRYAQLLLVRSSNITHFVPHCKHMSTLHMAIYGSDNVAAATQGGGEASTIERYT